MLKFETTLSGGTILFFKAFTLIEIILAIAVLGITAISIDLFTPDIPKSRLDSAIKQIISDLEYAKQNAMTNNTNSGVIFTTSNQYTAYESNIANPLKNSLTGQNLIIDLSTLFPGITITSNYTVEFNSLGAPVIGGGSFLRLSNGATNKNIYITSNTGHIYVQ